jgi:hypothetical protein
MFPHLHIYLFFNIISFMPYKARKKKLKLFLFMYLILALIYSSAISASETFCFEHSSNDNLSSDTYLSSVGNNIDWLAVVTIKKTRNNSNSLLRNKLLRVFTLAGIISITVYLAGAKQKTVKNDNIPIIKSLVNLNLRI